MIEVVVPVGAVVVVVVWEFVVEVVAVLVPLPLLERLSPMQLLLARLSLASLLLLELVAS